MNRMKLEAWRTLLVTLRAMIGSLVFDNSPGATLLADIDDELAAARNNESLWMMAVVS